MDRILALALCLLLCIVSASEEKPAAKPLSLKPLLHVLLTTDDAAVQRDVLQGMIDALQGRRLNAPDGWAQVISPASLSTEKTKLVVPGCRSHQASIGNSERAEKTSLSKPLLL